MYIYTLDALYQRKYIIDEYISLIWTERWQAFGDFQLDIHSTFGTRSILTPDTWLTIPQSNYVMRIETVEDDDNADGSRILTVKGRSIEAILLDRVAKGSLSTLTVSPQWTITDTPAAVARKIFHDICVTGILNAGDVISGVYETSFITSNIPEPVDPITAHIKPQTLYDATVNICVPWELGFRLITDGYGYLYYNIYSGSDRTTSQTILPAVVFATELDNLQNTKELTTIDKSKNVAYVFSPDGFQMVYPTGVDSTVAGFDRRILTVDASDITSASVSDVPSALIQRGREQLAASRTFQGFDGEISHNSQYIYGVDYNLGDVIEMRNTDGVVNNMRVTEQIFVSDQEGDRSYPTLVTNIIINTGSWLSWLNNKQWVDLDADPTTWSLQP
jgi:hypothetical protein